MTTDAAPPTKWKFAIADKDWRIREEVLADAVSIQSSGVRLLRAPGPGEGEDFVVIRHYPPGTFFAVFGMDSTTHFGKLEPA